MTVGPRAVQSKKKKEKMQQPVKLRKETLEMQANENFSHMPLKVADLCPTHSYTHAWIHS